MDAFMPLPLLRSGDQYDISILTPFFFQTRSFAAVLFRRMSTKTRKIPNKVEPIELFLTLPEPQRIAIQERLLNCLQAELAPSVRNKISDAVAEIARQYTDDGK